MLRHNPCAASKQLAGRIETGSACRDPPVGMCPKHSVTKAPCHFAACRMATFCLCSYLAKLAVSVPLPSLTGATAKQLREFDTSTPDCNRLLCIPVVTGALCDCQNLHACWQTAVVYSGRGETMYSSLAWTCRLQLLVGESAAQYATSQAGPPLQAR